MRSIHINTITIQVALNYKSITKYYVKLRISQNDKKITDVEFYEIKEIMPDTVIAIY